MRFLLYLVSSVLACAMADLAAAATLRVSPDKPLQHALDTAPPGATLVLQAGVHRGPVVIRHRLTILAEPGAHLRGDGRGTVLSIEADGVRIEGLAVSGSGRNLSEDDAGVRVQGQDISLVGLRLEDNLHGIYVLRSTQVELRSNTVVGLAAAAPGQAVTADSPAHLADGIHHNPPSTMSLMGNGVHLWNVRNATVADNHIHHARDGIYVAHTTGSTFQGNRIHDSRYGIHYMYSSGNAIIGNDLWRNVAGPALMFSRDLIVHDNILREHGGFRAYGLLLQNIETTDIRRNEIHGNRVGIRFQNSVENTLSGNHLSGNLTGMTINSSSRDNTFTRNVIGLNLHQIELTGQAPPARWSVDGVGNLWHGSMPMDLTGNGVSQWPHHEVDLRADRRERFPYVQLLLGSPGILVMEWAMKRAPIPGLRHITDPHPLTRERRHD